MEISATLVKELREKTGAGMMDCKKALSETSGDFEKAIELSGGRDLSAKVEFARGYARLVYDRELHDRLLNEVLSAQPRQEGLTLFNTLAQSEARQLLDSADDYF